MQFRKTVLENGLRIITAPQPGNLAVTVLVLVEAGSKYETKDSNTYNRGVSHFLEHMCFKGTRKRKDALQISEELDELGALYNAFTGQEYTGYYAKVQAKDLDKALDLISDIYLNSTLPEKDIDKEKGVIVEEINMDEDDPQHKVSELSTELMYGDQPAGWSIAGSKEDILRLKRKTIADYRKDHYVAEATVVVVAGAIDEDQAIQKIKKNFRNIRTAPKARKVKTKDLQTKPQLLLKHRDSDQTHMVLSFRAFPIYDKRRNAAEIMAQILGGGMSSRLFQLLRNKLGAAYYVSAGAEFCTDHGYLGICAGIDKGKMDQVLKEVFKECKSLRDKLVSRGELEKIKNSLVSNIILGLETSNSVANFYGHQEILERRILRPEEIIRQVRSITAKEIREVARAIFKDENLNLAVLGPIREEGSIREIINSAGFSKVKRSK